MKIADGIHLGMNILYKRGVCRQKAVHDMNIKEIHMNKQLLPCTAQQVIKTPQNMFATKVMKNLC